VVPQRRLGHSHPHLRFALTYYSRTFGPLIALSWLPTASAAQAIHEVSLEVNVEKEVYQFTPARVSVRPGDIVKFRTVSGAPHSIVFEAKGLTEEAHEALNGAMGRRPSDLSSPLLTQNGTEYRVVVPALPPGSYEFYCLPHRAYDMRGTLVVHK
jgi:plastocyanin